MKIMIKFTNLLTILLISVKCVCSSSYENDMTFKVDAGSRTCFFEKAESGQMMEVQYQVIDGQHGDLDISLDVISPSGEKIVSDFKKSQNSVIKEIDATGEYVFCFDNTFSVMNSKMVFIYILIEHQNNEEEAVITVVDDDGEHQEILEWMGHLSTGEPYYVEVQYIANKLMRILKHVAKARHVLDMYGALKSRDSHIVSEDTFIVDVWSGMQVLLMIMTGLIQVYMIKKLFTRPTTKL